MSKFWELGKFRNRWSPVIVMIVVEWDVKLGFAECAKKSRLSSSPSWNIQRVLNGEYLQELISHTLPETSKSHLKNRPSAKEMLSSCHSFSRGKPLVLGKFRDCSCELLVYQSWSCWRHNKYIWLLLQSLVIFFPTCHMSLKTKVFTVRWLVTSYHRKTNPWVISLFSLLLDDWPNKF